jgi:ubiquitin carboxyl-terminal hydrolase 4/11
MFFFFLQSSNAYLLFYRRRTERPLGGKTHTKIENARLRPQTPSPEPMTIDNQLPTPPNESETPSYVDAGMSELSTLASFTHFLPQQTPSVEGWPPRSMSLLSSIPGFREGLDHFERSFVERAYAYDDPLQAATQQYDFPDPPSKGSPTSSVEVQPDCDDVTWPEIIESDSPDSAEWQGEPVYSPDSSVSEVNHPLFDAHVHNAIDGNEDDDNNEGEDDASQTDIPIEETNSL